MLPSTPMACQIFFVGIFVFVVTYLAVDKIEKIFQASVNRYVV